MSRPAPAAEAVSATLDSLHQVLAESATLVRTGELVDLTGLEQEAREVLDAVLALPAADARALLPSLDRLLAALDGLAASLSETHGATLGGGERHAVLIRAAAAYRPREGS